MFYNLASLTTFRISEKILLVHDNIKSETNCFRRATLKPNLIRWPDDYAPDKTKVHVRNDIEIAAPPEIVWAWLVRAPLWPTWYSNSSNVKITGGGEELKEGSKFQWRTFGANLNSTVLEYVKYERLAWDAHGIGVDAYHAWLLEKRPSGCYVLTEENQKGFLARASNALRPNNMSQQHQNWLEGLKTKASGGPPA
jgi:uncharacterized protein YndB with AHSA1/START domain